MSYAIRAWRDTKGSTGITIGHVFPVGYDNHVAEIELSDSEIDGFLAGCAAARRRAQAASGVLDERMPGPYEDWERHERARDAHGGV